LHCPVGYQSRTRYVHEKTARFHFADRSLQWQRSTLSATNKAPSTNYRQQTLMLGRIMRMHPLLYEINTWSWLADLSREAGQRITLQSVPDAALDALATRGFDMVW